MQVFRDYRLIECETTMRRLTPIAIREVAVFDTEDVTPVVHAHWELYEDGWYCTNCELYAPFDCDPEEKGIPYCPNCGAKMDEEAE